MATRKNHQVRAGHIVVQATLSVVALGLAGWATTTSLRSIYPKTSAVTSSSTMTSTFAQRPGENDSSGSGNTENLASAPVSVMAAIGFSPDLLAVIGVTPSEFAALVAQANETAATDLNAIRSQSAAVSAASKSLAAKERELRLALNDTSRSTIQAQIETLRSQLATARSQLAATTAGVRSAYRGWLQADEQERLDVVSTKPSMQVPLYYATVSRTEADWVKLRDAIASQRYAARKSIELDSAIAAYLETINADQNVSAAKTRWEANATQLRGMWR